jgi:hypothetical protein
MTWMAVGLAFWFHTSLVSSEAVEESKSSNPNINMNERRLKCLSV